MMYITFEYQLFRSTALPSSLPLFPVSTPRFVIISISLLRDYFKHTKPHPASVPAAEGAGGAFLKWNILRM